MNESQTTTTYDVIVVGGGAAGMFAAIEAAHNGAQVLLLEKNARLGEKLRITGGGRCNITNGETDLRSFLTFYKDAEKPLYSPFSQFNQEDTIRYFDNLSLPTVEEAKKRVFPVSQSAEDVVRVLQSRIDTLSIKVLFNQSVTAIRHHKDHITSVESNGAHFMAKTYILATGGVSRPETGSTGDGFSWLAEMGHTIDEPSPNITPLALTDDWLDTASGVSLQSAAITFFNNDKRDFKVTGELLFTHFGVSGPVILNSAYRVAELLETGGSVTASIDTLPMMTLEHLDNKIIKTLQKYPKKQLKNVLQEFVPAGLVPLLQQQLTDSIDFEIKTSEVSREKRGIIANYLKAIPVTVDKLMGFDKAVVADGGLRLAEVDTKTMQSRLIDNLYVTGDLLNINRPSGGFSLQLCWTTGYVAGRASVSS